MEVNEVYVRSRGATAFEPSARYLLNGEEQAEWNVIEGYVSEEESRQMSREVPTHRHVRAVADLAGWLNIGIEPGKIRWIISTQPLTVAIGVESVVGDENARTPVLRELTPLGNELTEKYDINLRRNALPAFVDELDRRAVMVIEYSENVIPNETGGLDMNEDETGTFRVIKLKGEVKLRSLILDGVAEHTAETVESGKIAGGKTRRGV